jgi:hypothetical protein
MTRVLLIGVAVLGMARLGAADTFSYQGSRFDRVSGNGACYECALSGWLELDGPLAPGLEVRVFPVAFAFTDGIHEWDAHNTVNPDVEVEVDRAGRVDFDAGWCLALQLEKEGHHELLQSTDQRHRSFGCSGGLGWTEDQTYTFDEGWQRLGVAWVEEPGVWRPVPVPEPVTAIGLGLGLLVLAERRVR